MIRIKGWYGMVKKVSNSMYEVARTMNDIEPWPAIGDNMADKNRTQGKSKNAMTKTGRLKKKKVNHERSRRQKIETKRRLEELKAAKVMRACKSWRR
jgi:hypothetical protein